MGMPFNWVTSFSEAFLFSLFVEGHYIYLGKASRELPALPFHSVRWLTAHVSASVFTLNQLWAAFSFLACSRIVSDFRELFLAAGTHLHTLPQTCASDPWPQSWSLLFGSFAPSAGLWITTRCRMKIAAAIKFSGWYCLCAVALSCWCW